MDRNCVKGKDDNDQIMLVNPVQCRCGNNNGLDWMICDTADAITIRYDTYPMVFCQIDDAKTEIVET
jgi:hypothetical protein